MTQSPAGWHPQPDGRERYWDGSQWTDQYRTPDGPPPPMPQYQAAPQAKPKKSHTFRNVVLGIVVGSIVVVGGCIALIGGAANEVDKELKKDANKPGGTDNPLTIVEGKAFEVDGFNYAGGWRIVKDQFGGFDIKNLKVTNNRDDRDSALIEVKFWKGTEVLESVDCTTDPIQVGATVTLTCLATGDLPKGYDKITVNDTF